MLVSLRDRYACAASDWRIVRALTANTVDTAFEFIEVSHYNFYFVPGGKRLAEQITYVLFLIFFLEPSLSRPKTAKQFSQ
jgi:hypothetical protein